MREQITKFLYDSKKDLIIALLGACVGAFIALYALKEQREIEELLLARNLTDAFYENELFGEIRTQIESCEKVYRSNGGLFGHDEINRYLGFFEDLGFFVLDRDFLDIEIVAHLFGAYIIEAYLSQELQTYISDTRKNSQQPSAFTHFSELSKKLSKLDQFTSLTATFADACANDL